MDSYVLEVCSGGAAWQVEPQSPDVIDLEKIAKKEDAIVENRVYAPITVVVGDGRLVPGLEKDLKKARKDVLGGTPMSVALQSKYMPDMAVSLISIGEKTGALSEMLEGVADYFTSDMDDKIDGLTSAIEPIMTLIITMFVGILVLAVFLPMIEGVTGQLGW